MKKLQMLCLVFCILACNFSLAQQPDKAILEKLENEEREAILKGDTAMLLQLMSPQIVVHNPENKIVKFDQINARIKNGKINYASFQRIIENIEIIENMGIVMGKEIIKPQGNTTNPGKTVTRRFTNIWVKHGEAWKLTARQSTIISVQ